MAQSRHNYGQPASADLLAWPQTSDLLLTIRRSAERTALAQQRVPVGALVALPPPTPRRTRGTWPHWWAYGLDVLPGLKSHSLRLLIDRCRSTALRECAAAILERRLDRQVFTITVSGWNRAGGGLPPGTYQPLPVGPWGAVRRLC